MASEHDSMSFSPVSLPLAYQCLRNNQLPTQIERAQLQELLQNGETAEERIKAQLAELTARHTHIFRYNESLRMALAPSRKISSDIWATVFGFMPEGCWELSWVCRHWRNVALGTSSLWAVLPSIGLPIKSPANWFCLMEAHLIRSGSKSLTIGKLSLPLRFGFNHEEFQKFLRLFQVIVPRVGRVDVEAIEKWTMADLTLLAMFPQTFDSLTTINFHFARPTDHHPPPAKAVSTLENAQTLSRMSFAFPALRNSPPLLQWFNPPWSHFRSLELGWVQLSDLYKIMDNAPLLEEFTALINIDSASDHVPSKKIQHPTLQSLSVTSNNKNSLDIALLDLPLVQRVFINTNTTHRTRALPPITIFSGPAISPSLTFEHLTHLFLGTRAQCTGQQLADALQCTPSLFELWTAWLTSDMWTLFAALSAPMTKHGTMFLAPSLASLRICQVPISAAERHMLWHTTINQLAGQRVLQNGSEIAPLQITLTYRVQDRPNPRSFFRFHVASLLNQAIVLMNHLGTPVDATNFDVASWDAQTEEGIKELLEPLTQLRQLVKEYKPPSKKPDDFESLFFTLLYDVLIYKQAYNTWRFDWETRLQTTILHLASGEKSESRILYQLSILVRLLPSFSLFLCHPLTVYHQTKEELPEELTKLEKLFPDESSKVGILLKLFLVKWSAYRSKYLASPGWVSIEDTRYPEERRVYGITFAGKGRGTVFPEGGSELLSPCEWGACSSRVGELCDYAGAS